MIASEDFAVEQDGAVAEVRLCRGEALNALRHSTFDDLARIMRELDATGRTRAIILSAEGRHFCAGLDLGLLADAPDRMGRGTELGRRRATVRQVNLDLLAAFRAVAEVRAPVLVAVQGGAVGAGFDLTTYADLRYATTDAFFCLQQVNMGLVPDMGGQQRLVKLMPEGIVRELSFTGRRMSADEAARRGLVNEVFDSRDAMLDAVREVAHTIAAKSPLAVWGAKEMLDYARDHPVADGERYLATWQAGMFHQADVAEGYQAFVEKRAGQFEDLPRRRTRDT